MIIYQCERYVMAIKEHSNENIKWIKKYVMNSRHY